MRARRFEKLALMVKFAHAVGRGVDVPFAIDDHGTVTPGGLKELVHDRYILLSHLVAIVMLDTSC